MQIGIPKEIKVHEYRVGATPAMVRMLVESGHKILVQTMAGAKIGFTDDLYRSAGATIVDTPSEVFQSDLIIKVKEPQASEFDLMHEGQILFCFLHLAPDPIQAQHLLEKKVIAIAYETVEDEKGRLPLLMPMSEIAGRISIQVGAAALQINHGGKGLLIGGAPGVLPAKVVVIGGGTAGAEAARMAAGLGASVTVIDKDVSRLRELDALYGPLMRTLYSTPSAIEEAVMEADLVIGAVLIRGKTAPKLITRKMIKKMAPGSVIVDVAIDQGGCAETSRPTTHANPTYVEEDIVHYCVTNMPGACARTSTMALTHATMDDVLAIANKGWKKALIECSGLRLGLNACLGKMANASVASDLELPYVSPEKILNLI